MSLKPQSWSVFLLLLPLLLLQAPPIVSSLCRVSGGVLGVHWSSVLSLGWRPLANGRGGSTCWESCCLSPGCSAVWSLGERCVLLSCTRSTACAITYLPQPHQESLGLLQLLARGPVTLNRRRRAGLKTLGVPPLDPLNSSVPEAQPTLPVLALVQNGTNRTQTSNEARVQDQNQNLTESTAADLKETTTISSEDGARSTVKTTPSATAAVRTLVVSAGESKEVTLPRNEVELDAYVVPTPLEGSKDFVFDWRLITHPKDYSGEMEGQHSGTLKLSKLTVGLYEFAVMVDTDSAHGEAYVNVTVKPEPRVNKAPVAIVSPKFQEISLPISSTVIDGSQSTDDDRIVKYHWEEVKGPLRDEKVSADTAVLTLTSLVPGNYTFSLTVTDSDGASNSTQSILMVNKAIDYKPAANAGPNQVITLPRNAITLLGNQSTDDHDSLSYEWSLSPESKDKVVEMQGVRSPFLQVSSLEEGDYTFKLTVTDSSGQQDSAQVTVIVQPENNKAPVADAGPEKELTFPVDRTTLDGSKSHDDQMISSYQWRQSGGPEGVRIENANLAVATVTGLEPGEYEFTLTVSDERQLQSSARVRVIVREELDLPPQAHIRPSSPILLPDSTAFLDGSLSSDDKGSVSFMWSRDDSSPAAGDVLNGSDHQGVLFLGNLVQGTYSFTLTVTDSKGQSSKTQGHVDVRPDQFERDQVELVLEVPVSSVSQRQRDMLLRQVGVLLGVLDSDIIVHSISAFNELSTRLVFVVSGGPGRPPLAGHSVALGLRTKLRKQKNDFLIFKPRRVDTVICQLNCSGHGDCDSFSRRCVCRPFWMENFIRTKFGDEESNCDWSVLYVTIASFMVLVGLGTMGWGLFCCCNRRKSKVRRSKSRYKMLEEEEHNSLELRPPRPARQKVPGPSSPALMPSDSDLDSDAEPWPGAEQERGKLLRPQNGSLRNGKGLPRGKTRDQLL
ncbi:unnamed protein product [Knipowitschia caucasica]